MSPHVVFDISAHGYGHLAQCAPVIRSLARLEPALRLSVRSALPEALVRERIGVPMSFVSASLDVGMRMASAVDVLAGPSAAAYALLHQDWDAAVRSAAADLRRLAPDLVVADVPYLSLAGAAAAGIRAAAMCSLSWADIYWHYCGAYPGAQGIREQIQHAYASAQAFIQLEPSMPMPSLPRRRPVGPVAAPGRRRRAQIDALAGLAPNTRLILVGMGGVATPLPVERWPRLDRVSWVVPGPRPAPRTDCLRLEDLPMSFADVLASSDALLTKPGYGAFVEAACLGLPVLYVRRGDWPEEPYLTAWLQARGTCREVARAQLESGELGADLEALLALPRKAPVAPTGAGQAARLLLELAGVEAHIADRRNGAGV